MNNFLPLFRLDLRMNFSLKSDDKKAAAKKLLIVLLIVAAMAAPLVLMLMALYYMAQIAALYGGLDYIVNLVFMGVQLFIFIFYMPLYINVVYFSKDRELLASMPVGNTAVFLSRMSVLFINTALISLPVVITASAVIAAACAKAGVVMGAGFYIMMIFTGVTLPAIPLFLITVISFPIMKIVSLFKRASAFKTVILLVLYAAIFAVMYVVMFGLQNKFGDIQMDGSEESTNALLLLINSISAITGYIYPSLFAARAMCGINGVVSGFAYTGVILAVFILALVIAKFLFTLQDTRAHSFNRMSAVTQGVSGKSASARFALIRKDILTILREPQLALQTFGGCVILPVILVVYNLMLPKGAGDESENMPQMLSAISFFMIMVMSATNVLASIAVSREGERFSLIRSMPVSGRDIVISKLLLADLYTVFLVIISVICLIATGTYNYIDAIGTVVTVILAGTGINALSLNRDIRNPKFRFNNYNELAKSASKNLVSMLAGMGMAAAVVILTFALPYTGLSGDLLKVTVWGISAAIAAAMFAVFRFRCVKRMSAAIENIE